MSERYITLFSLNENLYAESSPVIIKSGALLKDNSTGKLLALIKFYNIGTEKICALKVRLNLFDIAGKPLSDNVDFQYLDLNVARDELFGQKTPIIIPVGDARSFSVTITEVIFASKHSVVLVEKEFSPLVKPKLLSYDITPELLKEYHDIYGNDCNYHTSTVKDLWYCTCGNINKLLEDKCHICTRARADFESINIEELEEEYNERRDRLAKAAKADKKTLMITVAAVVAWCIISVITSIINNIDQKNFYNDAMVLYENGKYEEARDAFMRLGTYSDSPEMIASCDEILKKQAEEEENLLYAYNLAKDYLENKNFAMAKQCFTTLGDYKDSKEMLTECAYLEAVHYVESDDYIENPALHPMAYEIFLSLGDYKDSEKYLAGFKERCTSFQTANSDTLSTYAYDKKGEKISYCSGSFKQIYSRYEYGDWMFSTSNRSYSTTVYFKGNYIGYMLDSYTPTLQNDGSYIMEGVGFKAVFYPSGKFTVYHEGDATTNTTHSVTVDSKNRLVSHRSSTDGIAYNGEPYTENLSETFKYNDHSDVIEHVYNKYDGWYDKTTYEKTVYSYEYDEKGRMTKKFQMNDSGEYELNTTYYYGYVYAPEATQ